MKFGIIKERGFSAVADVKEPTMRSNCIKIKTVALALSPTDLHHRGNANVGRLNGILGAISSE
ncbi:hypothetical protein P280DRAFT_474533 [Massarina eburnea CBS 473.64]|uniref:Uncharacterized protein n=1 Tax=Massarina eburnea CBS 473.64 TaxID=1395130 RepID=A0A6A6RJG0_9PLEO|nr:hypothetical protein P280DRAFT_474533 [Massarina eburnea CBS 473.64]